MNRTQSVNNGIGFNGLLAIVFIALKLMGEITWSWWWVLSPLWLLPVILLVVMVVVLLVGFTDVVLKTLFKK